MSSVLEKPTAVGATPSQVAIESGLTHADLAPTLRPLPEARTLPASLYTSPEVLRLEQEGLFAKMWLCVGREADIPTAGDYFTHQIGGESVIVVRGGDGAVRAFYNVCRHRGARLLDAACGKGLSRVVCPYHAWTYRLDGTLAQVPRMDEGFAARVLRPGAGAARHLGRIHLSEPRRRGRAAREVSRGSAGPRALQDGGAAPRQADRIRGGGQLEADLRELQRVLPLSRACIRSCSGSATTSRGTSGFRRSAPASTAGR